MLQTDEKILKILLTEKENGNKLLKHFKISYPNKKLAQQSNNIFVACVSYEETNKGFEFIEGKDLVEIVVVTKKIDNPNFRKDEYNDSKFIIKTVMKEIRKLLLSNKYRHILKNKPIFRNISPEYNSNYLFNRGHLLIELKTIENYDEFDDEIEYVNKLLLGDVETIVTTDFIHEKSKK